MSKVNQTTGGNSRQESQGKQVNNVPEVKIVVERHKQFFDLLNDPHRMWRVLLSLFLIIVVLFIGIAFVVLTIKRYYPYNTIETNLEGASIVNNEDKEVIYWLFNTADLWANSGIEVQKGDELTIYASGASYTAIHHLTKASKENSRPEDEWVGTEGEEKKSERDRLRVKFRVNKDCDEGTLLMQVVDKEKVGLLKKKEDCPQELLQGEQVEIIGKGRSNIRISKDGYLCFAVNDIVLTDSMLKGMYENWLDTVSSVSGEQINKKNLLKDFYNIKDNATYISFLEKNKEIIDTLNKKYKEDKAKYQFEKKGLRLGKYPKEVDTISHNKYPLVNELVYYKKEKFRDAWYMDNLGSFLIVIERKK